MNYYIKVSKVTITESDNVFQFPNTYKPTINQEDYSKKVSS